MNRTHAFVALAAALTLTAVWTPVSRWWSRPSDPAPVLTHASASGPLGLTAQLSHARPLEGGSTYLRYEVTATDARPASAQSVQMVLVLDRSGSMNGEKLERARSAALSLIDLLNEDDELAVVTFGSDTTEQALTRASTEGKQVLKQFIFRMHDDGGTNISGALNRAQALLDAAPLRGTRRVVLMSDGQPTEGMTGEGELTALAASMHERGLAVSALGVGYDFKAGLMQRLAERGGGFYAYLSDAARLTEVLQLELGQARGAVARNVTLRLELDEGSELVQVAGRDVVQHGNKVAVPLPDFAPGQHAKAYLELKVATRASSLRAVGHLEYFDGLTQTMVAGPSAILTAETTDDAESAEASKDEAVSSDCIRAVGATKMVAAAAAFERGDRASAFSLLDNARRIFAMSADSLAGDINEVGTIEGRWANTHDAQAVANESKNLNKKKMENFGMNNSY